MEDDLVRKIDELREKLHRAQRQLASYRAKSQLLDRQYDDARQREQSSDDLVRELLERQRELNVMLNRANIMLNRAHEAMALTSVEFNEMAKALPEPKKAEWSDRVARINDLFKKTGVQDAELSNDAPEPTPEQEESLDGDELAAESEHVFGRAQSIWGQGGRQEWPTVEAEPVETAEPPQEETPQPDASQMIVDDDACDADAADNDFGAEDPSLIRSWWRKIAG